MVLVEKTQPEDNRWYLPVAFDTVDGRLVASPTHLNHVGHNPKKRYPYPARSPKINSPRFHYDVALW